MVLLLVIYSILFSLLYMHAFILYGRISDDCFTLHKYIIQYHRASGR